MLIISYIHLYSNITLQQRVMLGSQTSLREMVRMAGLIGEKCE